MKVLKIKTKSWCRGSFCNEHGHMCALGFLAKKEGLDPKQYNDGVSTIEDDLGLDINVVGKIMTANDDLRGIERRDRLKKLFKRLKYKVQFV